MPSHRRQITLGSVKIGGDASVSIQSMTKTPTTSYPELLNEVTALEREGCDIVRIAVPEPAAIPNVSQILKESSVPIVADIHFDYRLALDAIAAGVHGIRVNPGNIRSKAKLYEIANKAQSNNVAIRVGINSGSLEPEIRRREGGVTPRGLVDSALRHCQEIESTGHDKIKVSIKASDVKTMVAANRLFAEESDIPLHVGVTEAGPKSTGIIKSSIGIGALLLDKLADTIRVSLSADSLEEVRTARKMLTCLNLMPGMPEIISCPTCARKNLDVVSLSELAETEINRLIHEGYRFTISKIAVMGCAVNGPGEAGDADLGIAGSTKQAVLFREGNIEQQVAAEDIRETLLKEIRRNAYKP